MELRLDVTTQAGVSVVRCQGRIVFGQEVDELRLTVLSQLKKQSHVVLNLGGIERLDSEGLAGIVGLYISARNRGGYLKLAHLSQRSKDVVRISRLDQIIETYDSEADAVASFQVSKAAVTGLKRPA
jgi:anti-sigma B factor antagonist